MSPIRPKSISEARRRALRVSLVQLSPAKGDTTRNIQSIRSALGSESDVVVFGEAALTGYFLDGGVRSAALSVRELSEALGAPPSDSRCDIVLGFYELFRRQVYNSMAYLEPFRGRYRALHVHRKIFNPTYGLFDERRYVTPGHDLRAFDTRFGRAGMLVCEEMWHSLPATILALDGAEFLYTGAASPARGFSERAGIASSSRQTIPLPDNLADWDRLSGRTAQEHGIFLFTAQLTGSEGGRILAGGSTAWAPDGRLLARAPILAQGACRVEADVGELDRVRTRMPMLADLRGELPALTKSLARALDRTALGAEEPADFAQASDLEDRRGAKEEKQNGDGAGTPREPRFGLRASRPRPGHEDYRALAIDAPLVADTLVHFLRAEFESRGVGRAVVGTSGGVDSSTTLILAAKALGASRVYAFSLPDRVSRPESASDARALAQSLGCPHRVIEIGGMVDRYANDHEPEMTNSRRGNVASRMRMLALFDQAAKLGAIPVGSGNKSERLLGYFTWHGDDAQPINPLGDLYKTQVVQLASHLGTPRAILAKPPSPDLIPGVHDEEELGITYLKADPILRLLTRDYDPHVLVADGFKESEVMCVRNLLEGSHWKRRPQTVALLSETSIGEGYRRPVDFGDSGRK